MMTTTLLAGLVEDLRAETAALVALLEPLDPATWSRETPAVGWTIADQVSHLAYFDETAALAVTDPDSFRRDAEELMAQGDDFADIVAARHHDRPGSELLAWFRQERAHLLDLMAHADPDRKLPWYGPPMSPASSVTARLMETWAHGYDVADALHVVPEPTARLRAIAHLGVATIGWSFRVHGQEVPTAPLRVELEAPDGDQWTWGPPDADDTIAGPALDFCLLVTQRRHRADLDLAGTGPVAREFLELAQAFAGPPGPGRSRQETRS